MKHPEPPTPEPTIQTKLPPCPEVDVTKQYIPVPASLDETQRRLLPERDTLEGRATVDVNKETLDLVAPLAPEDEPAAWPALELLQDAAVTLPPAPERTAAPVVLPVELVVDPESQRNTEPIPVPTFTLPQLEEPLPLITSVIPRRASRAPIPTQLIPSRQPRAQIATSIIPSRQAKPRAKLLPLFGALAVVFFGALLWSGLPGAERPREVAPAVRPAPTALGAGSAAPSRDEPTPQKAMLLFNSTPAGAKVFLSGVLLGETPLEMVASNEAAATLTVTKDGFEDYEKRFAPYELFPEEVALSRKEKAAKPAAKPAAVKPAPKPTQKSAPAPLNKNVVTNPFRSNVK